MSLVFLVFRVSVSRLLCGLPPRREPRLIPLRASQSSGIKGSSAQDLWSLNQRPNSAINGAARRTQPDRPFSPQPPPQPLPQPPPQPPSNTFSQNKKKDLPLDTTKLPKQISVNLGTEYCAANKRSSNWHCPQAQSLPTMPTDENDTVPDAAPAQQGATGDVEMTTEDADVSRAPEADETTAKDGQVAGPEPSRVTFMSYLGSPVVTLVVGQDDTQSLLTAHQGLLEKSPYFADICRQFVDDGSVRTYIHPRRGSKKKKERNPARAFLPPQE